MFPFFLFLVLCCSAKVYFCNLVKTIFTSPKICINNLTIFLYLSTTLFLFYRCNIRHNKHCMFRRRSLLFTFENQFRSETLSHILSFGEKSILYAKSLHLKTNGLGPPPPPPREIEKQKKGHQSKF